MATMPAQTTDAMYPVQFAVDYPDRPLNRLTSAFRIFVAIPILIVLSAVSGSSLAWSHESAVAVSGAGGMLVFGPLLMILFRRKYPRWWFDWNLELQRFTNRVVAYLALMDDRYPSTDEQQGVHLDYVYPDASRDLNRWLPLVKWLLVIPHLIVLAVSLDRGTRGCRSCVVRDPFHRPLPEGDVRLRRRRPALGPARHRVRVPDGH